MAATTLSVDVANEEVSAEFEDDKQEVTTDIPAGAVVAFSSSDATIVTVGAGVANGGTTKAPLSFLKAGNATLTATANDASGAPLPGFTPGTTDLVLTPGAAKTLLVAVDQAAPVPSPTPVP